MGKERKNKRSLFIPWHWYEIEWEKNRRHLILFSIFLSFFLSSFSLPIYLSFQKKRERKQEKKEGMEKEIKPSWYKVERFLYQVEWIRKWMKKKERNREKERNEIEHNASFESSFHTKDFDEEQMCVTVNQFLSFSLDSINWRRRPKMKMKLLISVSYLHILFKSQFPSIFSSLYFFFLSSISFFLSLSLSCEYNRKKVSSIKKCSLISHLIVQKHIKWIMIKVFFPFSPY